MFKRFPSFLRHVGPGVVTGAADDDPSGIATYTQAGAQFGTGLLWTVFLSLPFMAVVMLASLPASFAGIAPGAWAGLAYVSVFSMLIGFIFWYRGLALGGIAAVGQLQLLQPFFGLVLAATLLHEEVSPAMIGVTLVVVLCVAGARKFAR